MCRFHHAWNKWYNKLHKEHSEFKGHSLIQASFFHVIIRMMYMQEAWIQNFRLFRFCVSEMCTIMCITNAPLTSTCMLKILSELIISHTNGSSAKINKSLQLRSMISYFFYIFATKSIQNNQNLTLLADHPHKIWECPFKNACLLACL